MPSEIQAEIDRLPEGFIDEMLEAKAYRHAKELTESADTAEAIKRLPQTPMFTLAKEILMEQAARKIHG